LFTVNICDQWCITILSSILFFFDVRIWEILLFVYFLFVLSSDMDDVDDMHICIFRFFSSFFLFFTFMGFSDRSLSRDLVQVSWYRCGFFSSYSHDLYRTFPDVFLRISLWFFSSSCVYIYSFHFDNKGE